MNAVQWLFLFALGAFVQGQAPPLLGGTVTAESPFTVRLPAPAAPEALLPDSPFGVNTAFKPDSPDLEGRLKAMQQAGIKWGRQDFTWKRIEKQKGEYDWAGYDRLVEQCRQHRLLLFGNLRSEEHTSELQSPWKLVCRLLL